MNLPDAPVDIIAEEQSLHGSRFHWQRLILDWDQSRYRIVINDDGYAFQSYQRIDIWTDGGWKEIWTRHGLAPGLQQNRTGAEAEAANRAAIETIATEALGVARSINR